MLANNFYNIIHREQVDANWLFAIELNPAHRIYEGHFPEQPITPGVCMLQIIKECAEGILGKELFLSGISSCKFLSVVNPSLDKKIELKLTIKEVEETSVSILAEGRFQEKEFIKLKATLSVI